MIEKFVKGKVYELKVPLTWSEGGLVLFYRSRTLPI